MGPVLAAAAAILQIAPAATPSATRVEGDWDGGLQLPSGIQAPLILHFKGGAATLDSPDQSAFGAPAVATPSADGVVVELQAAKARFIGKLSADGAVLEGPWTQGPASIPARFVRRAPGAAAPTRDRPQTPKPPFPYAVEEVTFPGGAPGVTLAGTLTRPNGAGPFPAVVLIGGSGPQTRDEVVAGHRIFMVLADRLTRAGVAVLRYDKRGVGGSKGSALTATGADYTADARAAFAKLRTSDGIRADRVGLIGHSEGGQVAPAVAALDPAVAFMVLLAAPALPGDEIIVAQLRAIELASGVDAALVERHAALERRVLDAVKAGPDAASAKARVRAILLEAGQTPAEAEAAAGHASSPWLFAFLTDDPRPNLRKIRGPVLALYGSRDLQVPPALNQPPLRAALSRDRRAEIRELPGLNHMFQPAKLGTPQEYASIATTFDPAALDLIASWVAARGTERR